MDSGNYEAARDLFGAALELKLADIFLTAVVGSRGVSEEIVAALKRETLATADNHMSQVDVYLGQKKHNIGQRKNHRLHSMASTGSSSATCTTESETSATESEGEGSSSETEKPPYLYCQAFQYHGDASSLISGAVLVFNMGLVHHLQDKSSTKVRFVGKLSNLGLVIWSVDRMFTDTSFDRNRQDIFMKSLQH